MTFTKRLREGVRRGFITSSIGIWQRPKVKPGGRYRMEEGHIVVEAIEPISVKEITRDGFASRANLLDVARMDPARTSI